MQFDQGCREANRISLIRGLYWLSIISSRTSYAASRIGRSEEGNKSCRIYSSTIFLIICDVNLTVSSRGYYLFIAIPEVSFFPAIFNQGMGGPFLSHSFTLEYLDMPESIICAVLQLIPSGTV